MILGTLKQWLVLLLLVLLNSSFNGVSVRPGRGCRTMQLGQLGLEPWINGDICEHR